MTNDSPIVDPKKTRIALSEALIATMNVIKEETTATDALTVLLDRRTGEFRIASFPSDMTRTVEMLEKALKRIRENSQK